MMLVFMVMIGLGFYAITLGPPPPQYQTVTDTYSGGFSDGGCPSGTEYFKHIWTSLCGDQYNICVSFDDNCGNDIHPIPPYSFTAVAKEQVPNAGYAGYGMLLLIIGGSGILVSALSFVMPRIEHIRFNRTSQGLRSQNPVRLCEKCGTVMAFDIGSQQYFCHMCKARDSWSTLYRK